MKKPLIIAIATVVAVGLIGLGIWFGTRSEKDETSLSTAPVTAYAAQSPMTADGDHSDHSESTSPSTPLPSEPVDTQEATVPGEKVEQSNPDDPAVKLATETAQNFILNYGNITFRDAAATDWIPRTAAYATPELSASLRKDYGAGVTDMSAIKKSDVVQGNNNIDLTLLRGPARGTIIFSAHYDQTVSSKVSDGTAILGSQDKVVTVSLVNGQWKVSAFESMLGGGA